MTDLSSSDVCTKYRKAAEIANAALEAVIALCVEGADVVEVCRAGDALVEERCAGVYNKKVNGVAIDKGVAFPTCVSVNECVCHNSPLEGETPHHPHVEENAKCAKGGSGGDESRGAGDGDADADGGADGGADGERRNHGAGGAIAAAHGGMRRGWLSSRQLRRAPTGEMGSGSWRRSRLAAPAPNAPKAPSSGSLSHLPKKPGGGHRGAPVARRRAGLPRDARRRRGDPARAARRARGAAAARRGRVRGARAGVAAGGGARGVAACCWDGSVLPVPIACVIVFL